MGKEYNRRTIVAPAYTGPSNAAQCSRYLFDRSVDDSSDANIPFNGIALAPSSLVVAVWYRVVASFAAASGSPTVSLAFGRPDGSTLNQVTTNIAFGSLTAGVVGKATLPTNPEPLVAGDKPFLVTQAGVINAGKIEFWVQYFTLQFEYPNT